ncbi:MAG: glutamate--tRNA ligase [Candidatus Buchananbacteria bacterium RIFCSPHIGHO2_01_FULL_39_8]|uniref:Glutamate--tRNA ligase n=1 Tax=Candidatus Buchananbacteria bacterium RIFCSPHIGHO2_01_FULL_39_8 TaxID=1797533 RepID=A0A1G1Y207_9BACT|nr:MAG: glutamate--tRNA ligase [Candidatus Buchananbacteria bacterium RIFCSPHIGHO2_01_FULL_39_8]
MPKSIKTRFAPSPTGWLHVGGLRTALYAYLFAKHNKGEFLLRIEDTDQERKVKGAVENLQEMLKIFRLNWDNEKPMIQSERISVYQKYAEDLIKKDKAYYCFCSKERLDNLRKAQQQKGLPPMYDGHCRDISLQEISDKKLKEAYVIRFKMPRTGQTEFSDIIRGKVKFDNRLLDDPIILKSDGFPTYHLANVVDDHEMKISHVIRGEEWLPSAPKHLLIYQAFNWPSPEFAHLPLLLNKDKSKLSKRQGDVAVEDYLKKGYLPEALLNFVLLLGWNPKTEQEIFTIEEMIKIFDLAKVNKAGAIFDTQKLDWLNGYYIRQKSQEEFGRLVYPFFQKAGINESQERITAVSATEQQRIKRLDEIIPATQFFFVPPQYEPELLIWKKITRKEVENNLHELLNFLENLPDKKFNQKDLENEITEFINQKKLGVGEMLWPMRVALSGRQASPGPFEIAEVLGKAETIKRIKKASDLLQKA